MLHSGCVKLHQKFRDFVGLPMGLLREESPKNRMNTGLFGSRSGGVRSEGCTSCTPVQQALIIFQMHFYGSASAGPFFAVCAPQNGAYNKAPPLRVWSGGALSVRFYSRKAVCGIGDWDISARAIRLSLSGGAKQGDTGL